MTENKRFMVDDTGTLIDMKTRNTYDYVSDVVDLLNSLTDKNEQLKQPNCRNCTHFSCDNADIYCMKKEYDSIPNCSIAKDCDDYEGVYE